MIETIGLVVGFTLMAICCMGVFGLLVWSLIWVYQDAEARGKPGWAVALLVFLLKWPLSLLVWIVFRPQLLPPHAKVAHNG